MRFMTMVKSDEVFRASPPPMALIQAVGEMAEEAMRAGVMVEMGGLLPSAMGARVILRGGKVTVTDGPFIEAKEVVGGYAVFAVNSKDEAIEWSKRLMSLHIEHWPDWHGEIEIRQIADGPPE